jgi:hypothetical protein
MSHEGSIYHLHLHPHLPLLSFHYHRLQIKLHCHLIIALYQIPTIILFNLKNRIDLQLLQYGHFINLILKMMMILNHCQFHPINFITFRSLWLHLSPTFIPNPTSPLTLNLHLIQIKKLRCLPFPLRQLLFYRISAIKLPNFCQNQIHC